MDCHECFCFMAPPCSNCVECAHWDVDMDECDNPCDECEVHPE